MMAETLQQEHNLDPGESYAIASAVEQKGDELLMDERRGRQVATQLGLSIIGLLGILLLAKQRQLIPQIKPILDRLIQVVGFRVSAQLYELNNFPHYPIV